MVYIILSSTLATLSIILISVGVMQMSRRSTIQERLDMHLAGEIYHPFTLQERELSQPFTQRIIVPLARYAARFFGWMWPKNRMEALQHRLWWAGSPGRLSPAEFVGAKGLSMVTFLSVALLFGYVTRYPVDFASVMMLAGLGLVGFFFPDIWLSGRIARRQHEIVNSLPDALDMLTITTEAGLSFESGLQEIMSKWNNELSREFARVLRDIGMGQTRRESLQSLGERTGVPDAISFVAVLNQSEELGVSIGRVLKAQSEDMRIRRRQRAYERANQAPIKMMFPLVFLIFPSIFAVLLGPAVPQLLAIGG